MYETFINPQYYYNIAGLDYNEDSTKQQEVHYSPYHDIEQEVILYDGLPLKVTKIEEFQDFKHTGKNLIIIDMVNPEPYVPPPEPKRFRQSAIKS